MNWLVNYIPFGWLTIFIGWLTIFNWLVNYILWLNWFCCYVLFFKVNKIYQLKLTDLKHYLFLVDMMLPD
jgi:hypothetical protein